MSRTSSGLRTVHRGRALYNGDRAPVGTQSNCDIHADCMILRASTDPVVRGGTAPWSHQSPPASTPISDITEWDALPPQITRFRFTDSSLPGSPEPRDKRRRRRSAEAPGDTATQGNWGSGTTAQGRSTGIEFRRSLGSVNPIRPSMFRSSALQRFCEEIAQSSRPLGIGDVVSLRKPGCVRRSAARYTKEDASPCVGE